MNEEEPEITGAADRIEAADERYRASRDALEQAFNEFLSLLSEALKSPHRELKWKAALEVAYLFSDHRVHLRSLWDWIQQQATVADAETKDAFKISFLELLPEEPKRIELTNLLWEKSLPLTTRWMLCSAYNNERQSEIAPDYEALRLYRSIMGLPPLPPLGELLPEE